MLITNRQSHTILKKQIKAGSRHKVSEITVDKLPNGVNTDFIQTLFFQGAVIHNDILYIDATNNLKWYEYSILVNDFDFDNYMEVKSPALQAYCSNLWYHNIIGFYLIIGGKHYIPKVFKEMFDIVHYAMIVGRVKDTSTGKYTGYVLLNRKYDNNFRYEYVAFGDNSIRREYCNGYVHNNHVHINNLSDCNIPIYTKDFELLNGKHMVVGYNSYYVIITGAKMVQTYRYVVSGRKGLHIVDNDIANIANPNFLKEDVEQTGVGFIDLELFDK